MLLLSAAASVLQHHNIINIMILTHQLCTDLGWGLQHKYYTVFLLDSSSAFLSNRTFCNKGSVLYVCCSVLQLLITSGYCTLGNVDSTIKALYFLFYLTLANHTWLTATILDHTASKFHTNIAYFSSPVCQTLLSRPETNLCSIIRNWQYFIQVISLSTSPQPFWHQGLVSWEDFSMDGGQEMFWG